MVEARVCGGAGFGKNAKKELLLSLGGFRGKDGRKISIGDCALFKPPQDSPPKIGLIHCLTFNEDNNLLLGVNWLYRAAELKLGKGTLLDCAPNEIFFSFHKDGNIPAASLLHPCKVAFLPRGAELPKGVSSFVCRRVYDIANKCLRWLTDQDYVNEQQEEVDKLLYKTRTKMHATLQPSGRSPKQVNGPISTTQVKSESDNVQISQTSFPSQTKGKKRERGDHAAEPVKRERSSRTEDDSAQYRPESHLKSDIARITEKGGVVDVEGVEKLVKLMQPDRMERKMDLVSRSMLAGVIASTDKVDCLTRFVQLKGLPVLDEWLQDIHKGKVGDNNSSKDADNSVEEFLLVLLRALDKLPVSLHALQMCNIGRSVNHLRSHKNIEIQRKARGLVDTWKKRVEAEMNGIDTKPGSTQAVSVWSSKSRPSEASHGGSRTPSGSEVAIKSSITQHSASKATPFKSLHVESNTKSSSSSPGLMKQTLSPASCKESHSKTFVDGTTDLPLIRDDKSSSSNQPRNYSQSVSGKEDGKGFHAVSASASKITSSSSRNRKNTGGLPGVTGGQIENSLSRSSSTHRSIAVEKLQSALTGERILEGGSFQASNHKLIVKIPNRVPSPARGVGGGSREDTTIMNSQASSLLFSDKQEMFDHKFNEKSDACRSNFSPNMNVDSRQINERKDVLIGSGSGDGSPTVLPDEEQSMKPEDSRNLIEGLKTDQLKSRKFHEASFSPMNALIESCVKHCEAHSSLSLDDDVGMNLLASVAAGEMSRSDVVSPADSAERSSPAVEEVCDGDEVKSKTSPEAHVRGGRSSACNDGENDDKKAAILEGSSWPGNGLHLAAERNCAPSHASTEVLSGAGNKQCDPLSSDLRSTVDHVSEVSDKSYIKTDIKIIGGEVNKEILVENAPSSSISPVYDNMAHKDLLNVDEGNLVAEVALSDQLCHGDCKSDVNEGDDIGTNPKQKSTAAVKSENIEKADNGKLQQNAPGWKLKSETADEAKVENEKDKNCNSNVEENIDKTLGSETAVESQSVAGSSSTANDLKSHLIEDNVEQKEIAEQLSSPEIGFPTSMAHEAHKNNDVVGSTSAGIESDEADSASAVAEASSSSAAAASYPHGKIKFDLNEGFTVDDGKYGEPVDILASVLAKVQNVDSLPFAVNSIRSGHPASVMVAAAAIGPFVPPENLLQSKEEHGWKGCANTSAFHPADPRKAVEMPLASRNSPSDASTSKHGRVPLDFDLNVPDERVLEELSARDATLAVHPTTGFVSNRATLFNENSVSVPVLGSGGLDLDLNSLGEFNEEYCTGSNNKREGSLAHVNPLGVLPVANIRRDFDLNDGPGIDDSSSEHVAINQQVKVGTPSQLPRMNYSGLGGLSSWLPSKNTFSTVALPSMIPDRGDQTYPTIPAGPSYRPFGPAVVTPFTPDVYRGSVLSSSPAMSFLPSPFQYSVFPFGATFPLPSATFPVGATSYADSSSGPRLFVPPANSHLLGPVSAVSSQFQRPYMVSLPDNSSNGGSESSRKWVRQGLDLNAGPGATEGEVRDDLLPISSSQRSVASSRVLAEEHARMYTVPGGIMKRKEPEGGWDSESFRYKQPWQ